MRVILWQWMHPKPKKSWPWQHYFRCILLNLAKVMLQGPTFILGFGWIHCHKMALIYPYFKVWGVMYWAFSVSVSNKEKSGDGCHFWLELAQLSTLDLVPPSMHVLPSMAINTKRKTFNTFQKTTINVPNPCSVLKAAANRRIIRNRRNYANESYQEKWSAYSPKTAKFLH